MNQNEQNSTPAISKRSRYETDGVSWDEQRELWCVPGSDKDQDAFFEQESHAAIWVDIFMGDGKSFNIDRFPAPWNDRIKVSLLRRCLRLAGAKIARPLVLDLLLNRDYESPEPEDTPAEAGL